MDIGVAEHSSNVASINFNNEIASSDKVKAGGAEGMKKPIKLKLGLRIVGLILVPQNRAKVQGVAVSIRAVLHKNPSYATDR